MRGAAALRAVGDSRRHFGGAAGADQRQDRLLAQRRPGFHYLLLQEPSRVGPAALHQVPQSDGGLNSVGLELLPELALREVAQLVLQLQSTNGFHDRVQGWAVVGPAFRRAVGGHRGGGFFRHAAARPEEGIANDQQAESAQRYPEDQGDNSFGVHPAQFTSYASSGIAIPRGR